MDAHEHAHWTWDPLILGQVALFSLVYGCGLLRLLSRAGGARRAFLRRGAVTLAGVLVLVLALISPIAGWSEQLGSVHMIQHMLLMMVAAPLIVLGMPFQVAFWVLPGRWRQALAGAWRRVGSWRSPWYLLWQPVVSWALFAGTLWAWHHPGLYGAALASRGIHYLQHLAFFIAACLFWSLVLDPVRRLGMGRGTGILYLFTTSLHAALLGVFMALAPEIWYPEYRETTGSWGLSALEDQQLAGLIMWMPACTTYVVVTAIVFTSWLREAGRARSTGRAEGRG
jgi:putative membrane protein